jgi:uncharacterized protein
MGQPKKIITIVGEKQAKLGFEFIYMGPSSACKGCNFAKVCLEKLEEGQIYEVALTRDKEIPCKVHADRARVVEVVEVDIPLAMDRKDVFEGATIVFKRGDCGDKNCHNTKICLPIGLKNGEKYKIVEVLGPISCSLQKSLVSVLARRAPKVS